MSKKKSSGLGKGLGALIPKGQDLETAAASASAESSLRMVPVKQIRPNPHQPRTRFDEEKLAELADSIIEHGLIQPLVVAEVGPNDYTLIAGERRWRASQLAKLQQVPVVVKSDTTPLEMLELAIIENVQRDDLNALEEGLAYRQLMDEFGLTQAEVAKRMGKGRPTIANMIRLLELPSRVQEAVVNGEISGGHARALLRLNTEEQQLAVMKQIIRTDMSVRRVEEVVRLMAEGLSPPKRKRKQLSPDIEDLQKQFRSRLNTRVEIDHSANGGKVVIHYYSDEELNAIYDNLIGE